MNAAHKYFAYIVSSRSGTLYIGMTNNIYRRALEHKSGEIEGFSSKYHCARMVYYESFDDVQMAIAREKQLKGWRRSKKIVLIEAVNPHWLDLARNWYPWMKNSESGRGASTPRNDSLRESSSSAQHDNKVESKLLCHPERSTPFTK